MMAVDFWNDRAGGVPLLRRDRAPEEARMLNTPKRVLIVDDEQHVLFVLQDSLRKLGAGVEVEVARSGEEALAKIREAPFDLVVTDLKMPGMGGVELTQAISAECPGTLVIWMTAHGSQQWRTQAAALAAYQCVDKPLDIAEIRRIVSDALAHA
jgi:DNA-binding NtrC family response regulator